MGTPPHRPPARTWACGRAPAAGQACAGTLQGGGRHHRERDREGGGQSSLPHFILGSRNSHIHAGTARNCTLQGGLRQLVLVRPFSTVVYDQDKSIEEK